VEADLPLACPAGFMKTASQNDSDDGDHDSENRRKVIGIPSES
jgi:hypothetical protein